jgi:hypothetical protein
MVGYRLFTIGNNIGLLGVSDAAAGQARRWAVRDAQKPGQGRPGASILTWLIRPRAKQCNRGVIRCLPCEFYCLRPSSALRFKDV